MNHRCRRLLRFLAPPLFSLALVCAVSGCAKETGFDAEAPTGPDVKLHASSARGIDSPAGAGAADSPAPAGLVETAFAGSTLRLWPYTGSSLDGTPSDPVNLLFVGEADPVAIRDALLALNGDRSAAGFPPVPPFDARWSDAIGDAQTNWSAVEGWGGSAIQLQLGGYEPVRFHLRLFRTAAPFPGGGTWTVGAAHFEVMIPGTADHQVLSWERAEQVVIADLLRSGLLDANQPIGSSEAIHAAPTFRDIPPVIYNGLPAELVAFIEGPPQPAAVPVGIRTDGRATILHLARRAPDAGPRRQSFTITYDQVVPRPLCSQGPADYIHVSGPVRFEKSALSDGRGGYTFDSSYGGRLTAVPMDVTQDPPVPAGEPFEAVVSEAQRGSEDPVSSRLSALTRRLVPGVGGSEFVTTRLRVGNDGADVFTLQTRCR